MFKLHDEVRLILLYVVMIGITTICFLFLDDTMDKQCANLSHNGVYVSPHKVMFCDGADCKTFNKDELQPMYFELEDENQKIPDKCSELKYNADIEELMCYG